MPERMGKGIQRELCKRFKFYLTDKWYMHKPESENETQKILGDFKADHQIPNRRVNLLFINKKK